MWNDKVIEAIRRCRKSHLDLSSMGLGVLDLSTEFQFDAALPKF